MYTAVSMLIQLGFIEQHELWGPNVNPDGSYYIEYDQRQTEIDSARSFLYQHIIAVVLIVVLLVFIKTKKNTIASDELLDRN